MSNLQPSWLPKWNQLVKEKKSFSYETGIVSLLDFAREDYSLTQLAATTLQNNMELIRSGQAKVSKEMLDNSTNMAISIAKFYNNSRLGLIYGTDFWLLPFNKSLVEIKTGQAWKKIAIAFSKNPISYIKCVVVFKGDKEIFEEGINTRFSCVPNLDVDRTKYENILYAVGIVKYASGDTDCLRLSKEEIEAIKSSSASKASPYSPWSKFPIQMVEGKVLRALVKRVIVMDDNKLAEAGLIWDSLDEERPCTVAANGQLKNIPFAQTQQIINATPTEDDDHYVVDNLDD